MVVHGLLSVLCVLFLVKYVQVRTHPTAAGHPLTPIWRYFDSVRFSFLSNSQNDVVLTGETEASCELSLKAHADKLLSQVTDQELFIQKLIAGSEQGSLFVEERTKAENALIDGGCLGSIVHSLHAGQDHHAPLPVTVFLGLDLPPETPLPLYRGVLTKECQVRLQDNKRRIVLENMEIQQNGDEDNGGKNMGTEMALHLGAMNIVFEVDKDAQIDVSLQVSCSTPTTIRPVFISLSKFSVDDIRSLLQTSAGGPGEERSRSFMVAAFEPNDFLTSPSQ